MLSNSSENMPSKYTGKKSLKFIFLNCSKYVFVTVMDKNCWSKNLYLHVAMKSRILTMLLCVLFIVH